MAEVRGVVDGFNTNYDKYSINVNGAWYSTKMEWAKVKPVKGDKVVFDDAGGKYTKNLKIVKAASEGGSSAPAANTGGATFKGKTFPLDMFHPDRSIIRQNSLAHATKLISEGYGLPADSDVQDLDVVATAVIAMAEKFEYYSSGQDIADAAAELEAMS